MGVNKLIGGDILLVSLQCQVLTTFIIGTLSTQKEGKGKVYVQYYKERHTHKGERSDLKVKVKRREVDDSDHTWSSKDYTDPLPLLPLS